ncbi:RICIN domain-containing protein [Kitasatospora sp. NPDC001574]
MSVRTALARRLGPAAAVLALVTTAVLAGAGPAAAYEVPTEIITIDQNVVISPIHSRMCLEVTDWRTDDGAPVRQWPCTGGANQKWRITEGAVVNVHSGKCLEIPGYGTTPGTPVGQWACNGGSNQRWGITGLFSGLRTYREFVNVHSGLALDVAEVSFDPGAPAIQWPRSTVVNQFFFVWKDGSTPL